MKSVAVIGAGIFGASSALVLSEHFNVTLFEQDETILAGASYGNQNRFHYGYHYPRSLQTGRDCLSAIPAFKSIYGDSLIEDFQNYYCVAKDGSKVSKSDYLKFCEALDLPYREEWPAADLVSRDRLCLSIRGPGTDIRPFSAEGNHRTRPQILKSNAQNEEASCGRRNHKRREKESRNEWRWENRGTRFRLSGSCDILHSQSDFSNVRLPNARIPIRTCRGPSHKTSVRAKGRNNDNGWRLLFYFTIRRL